MKRFTFFVFLPVMLFALEPVNLIKNVGFEKDSELWLMRSRPDGEYDSTVINRHDQDSAYIGNYCGSIDTRICPAASLPNYYSERGYLYQVFALPKKLDDLDSLELFHMSLFRLESVKISACSYTVQLKFINPSNQTLITGWYTWLAPNLIPADDTPTNKFFHDTLGNEGTWYSLRRDLKADLIDEKSLSGDIELDTFLLHGSGVNYSYVWRGQKVFFDGVRLTGYADYDVGVKEILSGDSIWEDTSYTPEARIKNFGREDAPEFSVIAEIWEGETRVYYDYLVWSLTSDTEDIVSFTDFTPSSAANHTLIVRTVMEPDESDEDDVMIKTLFGTGISEPVTHLDAITLDVRSLTHPLHVTYSLPYGEPGTLTLYDAAGRRIERMTVKGSGRVEFESALPSGVYIVRLETGQMTITKKAVVLR